VCIFLVLVKKQEKRNEKTRKVMTGVAAMVLGCERMVFAYSDGLFKNVLVEGGQLSIGVDEDVQGWVNIHGDPGDPTGEITNNANDLVIQTNAPTYNRVRIENDHASNHGGIYVTSGGVQLGWGSVDLDDGRFRFTHGTATEADDALISSPNGEVFIESVGDSHVIEDYNGDALISSSGGASVVAGASGDVVIQLGS